MVETFQVDRIIRSVPFKISSKLTACISSISAPDRIADSGQQGIDLRDQGHGIKGFG